MSLPSASTRRPVAVWMLFLAVTLLGVISYVRLPIDLLPDVSYPRLVVYTSYPEVAPAEVERQVTERVEAAAAGVPGVERVTSVSREGLSLVTLRFAWGTDMDFAVLNVREHMDNVRDALPETATRPTILRVDPESEPIMTLSVAGGEDLWRTKELAETVFRRRLEQLDGVARAAVTGGLDREIQVEVDPRLLEAYGLTIADVSEALASANVSAPGGTILQGRFRYPLRTLGEFQTVDEIERVIVSRQGGDGQAGGGAGAADTRGAAAGTPPAGSAGSGGQPGAGAGSEFRVVRLSDVATVVDGFAERESVARYAGREAVGILVFKESGANTVAVAESVAEVLDQLAREYPSVRVDVASSQAGFIAQSISNVVGSLVSGGLLAFLVLFLFLRNPRYPAIIALSIPVSVIATFALMDAAGVSLNIMSLGGLALGVGMLVDNSIVVIENIFRRSEESGLPAAQAAAAGAGEVQGAITASTLTTIAVFGPVVYVEGVAGELFEDLSLAVAFSLLASLVVALMLVPSVVAKFAGGRAAHRSLTAEPERRAEGGGPPTVDGGRVVRTARAVVRGARAAARVPVRLARGAGRLGRDLLRFWGTGIGRALSVAFGPPLRAFDRVLARFAVRYHAALEWALDHSGPVLAASALAIVFTLSLATTLPRDLLPDVDQGAFTVRLELDEGSSLETTLEAAAVIEAELLADPDVDAVFSNVGRDVQAHGEDEQAAGLHTATLQVRVREGARGADVADRARALAGRFPPGALSVETGQATALGTLLGGSEADVAVRVQSENLELAYAVAEDVRARLGGLANLGNVRVATERGQPEIQVEIDRAACAAYGIDPQRVATTVEHAMRGDAATEFVDFDRKITVVVRYPDELRYSVATLDRLRVDGIPIRELVHVREALGPAQLRREDQARVVPVYADVVEGGLDQAVADIEAALASLPRSRDVLWSVGGENEEMRRSFGDLTLAFGLALILVYMILAAQFESFVHPFTVLMSTPLALIGAVLALFLTGQGLNTMSLIGIVILVGIVDNDAIVKVDFINQARAAGLDLRAAILEAGRVRLRPILMTTVTTIVGLLPMALGFGSGAELRQPLAIAVIGGLGVATSLTLIVVPVVYQTVDRVRARLTTAAVLPEPAAASAD